MEGYMSEQEYMDTIELGYIPEMDRTVIFKEIGSVEVGGSTELVGWLYGVYDKVKDMDTIMEFIGRLKAEYEF